MVWTTGKNPGLAKFSFRGSYIVSATSAWSGKTKLDPQKLSQTKVLNFKRDREKKSRRKRIFPYCPLLK